MGSSRFTLAFGLVVLPALAVSGCGGVPQPAAQASAPTSPLAMTATAPTSAVPVADSCTPTPKVSARRTGDEIRADWSVGTLPAGCGRVVLLILVRSKVDPQLSWVPEGQQSPAVELTGPSGSETFQIRDVDEPPHFVVASTLAEAGGRSTVVNVPVAGDRHPPAAVIKRKQQRLRDCTSGIGKRVSCRNGYPEEPLRVTSAELTKDVRWSLSRLGAWPITHLGCVGRRCSARFAYGKYRLGMTYTFTGAPRAPRCWRLLAWSITRPEPRLARLAPFFPDDGCAGRP